MKVITKIKHLKEIINKVKLKQQKVGFVPTMGYLHEGHLSLINVARKECEVVILSIFVNPLQFGPSEDFEQYPRDEEADIQKAEKSGVDYIFIPSISEMYPEENETNVIVSKGTDVLCGKSRPSHFQGVATVVTKLFHIIEPTQAYFGLKDAQQFAVIHTLIEQLNFPIKLIGLQTVREKDGLAKSSRNVYLTMGERNEALLIHQSLKKARAVLNHGEKDLKRLEKDLRNTLKEKLEWGIIEYFSILSYPNLSEINYFQEQIIIAVAVKFSKARLIDNVIIDKNGYQVQRIDI